MARLMIRCHSQSCPFQTAFPHTLCFETATWNPRSSPACDLCEAYGFICGWPRPVSSRSAKLPGWRSPPIVTIVTIVRLMMMSRMNSMLFSFAHPPIQCLFAGDMSSPYSQRQEHRMFLLFCTRTTTERPNTNCFLWAGQQSHALTGGLSL